MALVSCPNCGNQVSDKAPACPHCGVSFIAAPNPQQTMNTAPNPQQTMNAAPNPRQTMNTAPNPQQTMNAAPNPQQMMNAAPNYGAPLPAYTQAPPKSSNKAGIIVGIVIAVVAVAVLGFFVVSNLSGGSGGGSSNGGGSAPTETYAPADTRPPSTVVPSDPEKIYTVFLTVACRENSVMNKYDIDIIIDGNTAVETLAHGDSKTYPLQLSEGSHQILFRLNQFPDKMVTQTLYVDGDTEASYYVKCTLGNNIEVERR